MGRGRPRLSAIAGTSARAVSLVRHRVQREVIEWDDDTFERNLERVRSEATINAAGVRISSERLARILKAAPRDPDPLYVRPLLKDARFEGATFEGEPYPRDSTSRDGVDFLQVTFQGEAHFENAIFHRDAWFDHATFHGDARFDNTIFRGDARFRQATFQGRSSFYRATFHGNTQFYGATFQVAEFDEATFESGGDLGPVLAVAVDLGDTVFAQPIRLLATARWFSCREAQFRGGAELLLRRAEIVLDNADFAEPSIVAPLEEPVPGETARDEGRESDGEPMPRVVSVRRARVANLTVAGVDLSACRFEGTHGLDQLRLEGVRFAETPAGWQRTRWWGLPVRWTRRQTIAEEHHWRAEQPGATGWYGPEVQVDPELLARLEFARQSPDQIAAIYRALRKGREDSKDEPGAADFYYGEMEMRRQAPRGQEATRGVGGVRPTRKEADARRDPDTAVRSAPRSERLILWFYWLVSGYGLRASRALIALALTVCVFAFLFDWWGFRPDQDLGRALLFSIESTSSLFRVPETNGFALTAGGEVLQVLLRLLGPLFFGLTLLSLRGRVKR